MYNAYSVNTLRFDQSLCNGCMMCIMVCPHAVFAQENKKVRIMSHSACMECGACRLNCPEGAIQVISGVGCATAMFVASLRGRKMDECSCG